MDMPTHWWRIIFTFLGIQSVERRQLSRPLLRSMDKKVVDRDFVGKCWRQPEREYQYTAPDYLLHATKRLTTDDIPRLRQLALKKSWWDTIDVIDKMVGAIALRCPEVNDTLIRWNQDKNFWLRRIAINHQRMRKERTDTHRGDMSLLSVREASKYIIAPTDILLFRRPPAAPG